MTINRIICLTLLSLLLVVSAGINFPSPTNTENSMQTFPTNEVIRFHVVANSDESRDQEVKIMVTEEVLDYVEYMLVNTRSKEEARRVLSEEIDSLKIFVEDILEREGTPHPVEIIIGNHIFPSREYVYGYFPEGEYESLRIIIGDGAGENWWCVLFPPLCFSHRPKTAKSSEEGSPENSSVSKILLEDEEIEIRFRIVEWANRFFPAYYRAEKKGK